MSLPSRKPEDQSLAPKKRNVGVGASWFAMRAAATAALVAVVAALTLLALLVGAPERAPQARLLQGFRT